METFLLFLLLLILAGWLYRGFRSLSELAKAPVLRAQVSGTGPCSESGSVPIFLRGTVTILIPAKNEEKNIADCVRPLLTQLREGDEVIVINNCSTDRTEAILNELGAKKIQDQTPLPPPLQKGERGGFLYYLNTPLTPDGWTGKNFALHLGMFYASGHWLLFTDADTRHQPGSLDASVGFAEKNSVDLLTLLPRCLAQGFWENVIQPPAMGYMGLWFPLQKINDPRSKTYFANGQYLLLRREHYQKIGGHSGVKEAFLEDFALMKKTKEAGGRGVCGFGMEIYGTRMYDSFGALWRGWRRIYLHAFEQNPWRLLLSVLSVFLFSVLPFFLILPALRSGSPALGILATAILVIIFATAFKTHGIVKARKIAAVLHPLAAFIFTLILIDALQMALYKRPTHWR